MLWRVPAAAFCKLNFFAPFFQALGPQKCLEVPFLRRFYFIRPAEPVET
jgi:hypothetical protein